MLFNSFFLSKLLPTFISPFGIVLILLLGYIKNRKIKFIYSAISILIIFSNGVVANSLWGYLERPWKRIDYSEVGIADGIVVLSFGRNLPPGDTKIVEWRDPDRFLAGIDLYKAKKAKRLIFTGNKNPIKTNLPPEGDIYIREAMLLDISRDDLYTTNEVFNTFQEAKAVKILLNKEISSKSKNIILVTSAFHMKRAKRLFEREGIMVKPFPVDFNSGESFFSSLTNPILWIPNSKNFNKNSQAIREIIARVIYRVW